jgi:hypothetical protein
MGIIHCDDDQEVEAVRDLLKQGKTVPEAIKLIKSWRKEVAAAVTTEPES